MLCNILWHGVEHENSPTKQELENKQANKIESRLITSNLVPIKALLPNNLTHAT